jgi:hypothetical protein
MAVLVNGKWETFQMELEIKNTGTILRRKNSRRHSGFLRMMGKGWT